MKHRLYPFILAGAAVIALGILGVRGLRGARAPEYSADVVAALGGSSTEGFARALTVRPFVFPADHAAHGEFQTEWWYNTGNLSTAEGRRFGIHFTIFRRALSPTMPKRDSEWATNQVYFADFALADVSANQFYVYERFSRSAAGLAGAEPDPAQGVRIWLEDWAIRGTDSQASGFHLKAGEGDIALDLTLRPTKPPALQGDRGLSLKSSIAGSASYYYSLTRNEAQGTITVKGETFVVSGTTWFDHEFSTSVLGENAVGWDWFSIQLDHGREVMFFTIRQKDGGVEPNSHGTLIEADGTTHELPLSAYTITPLGTWASERTGAVYPSGWRITIQTPTGDLLLKGTPLLLNQELNTTTAYWEGATRFTGTDGGVPVSGYGYVELTGYNRSPAQREYSRQ